MIEPADEPWSAAMRSAFDNSPLGMAVAAPDGTLMAVNDALCRLLQVDCDGLLGVPLFARVHPADRQAALAECAALAGNVDGRARLECRFQLEGGEYLHVRVTSSRVDGTDELGRAVPAHVVMHLEDVTDRHRREHDLRLAALHDVLTGLPNRALLEEHLQHALDARRGVGEAVVVHFLDLDGFKEINDQHGHAAGDAVLVAVAARLRSCLRPGDVAARVGGDEFVVLSPGLPVDHADDLGARLRQAICAPVSHERRELEVAVSIGSACSAAAMPAARLLHAADLAMYADKTRPRLATAPAPREPSASSS